MGPLLPSTEEVILCTWVTLHLFFFNIIKSSKCFNSSFFCNNSNGYNSSNSWSNNNLLKTKKFSKDYNRQTMQSSHPLSSWILHSSVRLAGAGYSKEQI